MINKILNNLYNMYQVFLIKWLGLFIILWYFWYNYIRMRIPRDIPFNLSLISTSTLLIIITCFVIIIYRLLKPHPTNSHFKIYLSKILKPVSQFDYLFRNMNIVKTMIIKINMFISSINFSLITTTTFFIIINITTK